MYQEYHMDVEPRSIWKIAPELSPRQKAKPPFLAMEAGKFYARAEYFTVRRDKNDKLLLFTVSGAGRIYTGRKTISLKAGRRDDDRLPQIPSL